MGFLKGRKSFIYVDNEGTKFSLIKGTSDNSTVDLLVHVFVEHEIFVSTLSWISRVSSHSNIAENVSAEAYRCLDQLLASLEKKLGETAGSIECDPAAK